MCGVRGPCARSGERASAERQRGREPARSRRGPTAARRCAGRGNNQIIFLTPVGPDASTMALHTLSRLARTCHLFVPPASASSMVPHSSFHIRFADRETHNANVNRSWTHAKQAAA